MPSTKWNMFGMETKIIIRTMKLVKKCTILLNIIISVTTYLLLHHKRTNSKPMMSHNVRNKAPDLFPKECKVNSEN